MLTKNIVITLLVITTGIFSLNGCSEDSPTNSESPLNVNYNALYVVNGESNNISIIVLQLIK